MNILFSAQFCFRSIKLDIYKEKIYLWLNFLLKNWDKKQKKKKFVNFHKGIRTKKEYAHLS